MATNSILPEDIKNLVPCEVSAMFKFFHLNTRSIQRKHGDITVLMESFKVSFDVIMFTETWYNDNSDHFVLPGYSHFFLNRQDSRGGGVSIQVAVQGFDVIGEFSTVTCDFEIICIKRGRSVFAVLYRPAAGNVAMFLRFLDSLLSRANECEWMLTIGGDLNIDFLKNSGPPSELLLLLQQNGFENVIATPTRVTGSTASLLDTFITNAATEKIASGVVSCDIDHLPIFFIIKRHKDLRKHVWPETTYRKISPQTLDIFRRKISRVEWNQIYAIEDSNKSYDAFLSILKQHYMSSFPLHTYRKQKKLRKPWITRDHTKLIKQKINFISLFFNQEGYKN